MIKSRHDQIIKLLEKDVVSVSSVEQSVRAEPIQKPELLRVAATSRATAVAGAIANIMRVHRFTEMQAIGAGAVNQAVKALAIARSYLRDDGIDIVSTPELVEVDIDGAKRTAVRFSVEPRPAA